MCAGCISKTKNLLCRKCSATPFSVEEVRKKLALLRDYRKLQKLYNKSFPEIKNFNTGVFWDKKISQELGLYNQDGMTQDRIKQVASFIPSSARSVWDIGAGHGFIEELLSKRKIILYGTDISKIGITSLQSRFLGTFKIASAYKNPFFKKHFDVVLTLELLEHISPHRVFSVYKIIYNALKKNAVLIASVPLNEGLRNKKNNPSEHVREYSKELFFAELQLAGFAVEQYKELFAFREPYMLRKLVQKWLFPNRWHPNNIVVLARKT